MRFFRLEKKNYVTEWVYAILKAIGISLVVTIVAMLALGYKFMIVSSGSMEPTLPVGSLVVVTPCEYDDLELYDIVTFTGESGVNFTHRIAGKNNRNDHQKPLLPGQAGYEEAYSWVTKGDYEGAKVDEGYLISKTIVGKIYENHCFTFTGLIVRYIKSNYIMVIVSLMILVGFVEVINFLKKHLQEDDIECYETDEEE